MGRSKISIEIQFSDKLDTSAAKAIKTGSIKSKSDVLNRLAEVYQKEIQQNTAFMKPLKALDKDVTVEVVISEE